MNVIGIDVGGTNTDAVRVSNGRVSAFAKVPTTPDVQTGIVASLSEVSGSGPVERVHIGTTAFTNALVERRDLAPTAAIRIGLPASQSLAPMVDWPDDLRAAVRNAAFFVHGGREYNGRAITRLDRREIEAVGAELRASGITQAAITSVFGTSYPEEELKAAAWLHESNPQVQISLSHRIGRFGILERENATMLNAMLRPLAESTLAAYARAVPGVLFISQNDGTVMSRGQGAELPVFTVASGPTNSLRGAALLTGLRDALVVDVGGTTSDIGVLRGGYPQLAGIALEVAGVRTNLRMPDLCSTGIGGGSLVDPVTGEVGPESVGFRLTERALVFGGDTLTLTDVAVAAERAEIGDRNRVRSITRDLVALVDRHLRARFARLLENFERAGERLPIILVGGGAPLVAHIFAELGNQIVRTQHASVANAYGAAMAQVGGEVEMVFALAKVSRAEALKRVEAEAQRRTAEAGARPNSIQTIELEDAAMTYLASAGLRVRARAVGDL